MENDSQSGERGSDSYTPQDRRERIEISRLEFDFLLRKILSMAEDTSGTSGASGSLPASNGSGGSSWFTRVIDRAAPSLMVMILLGLFGFLWNITRTSYTREDQEKYAATHNLEEAKQDVRLNALELQLTRIQENDKHVSATLDRIEKCISEIQHKLYEAPR